MQEQELDLEERSPPRPCVRELPRPPVPPGSPALPLSEEQVPVPRENVGKCRKSPGISGSSSSHLQVYFLGSFCHRSFGNRQEGEVPEVPEVPKEAAEESTKISGTQQIFETRGLGFDVFTSVIHPEKLKAVGKLIF